MRGRVIGVGFLAQRRLGEARQRGFGPVLARDGPGAAAGFRRPVRTQRALGRLGQMGKFGIERTLERRPAGDEPPLLGEEPGGFVDVRGDRLEQAHGVLQQRQRLLVEATTVVVELADVVLHRLRDLDALARARRLGDAAQRVARAVQRFRHRVGRDAACATLEELADDQDVARGFLAVDVAQDRVHRRLLGRFDRSGSRLGARAGSARQAASAGAAAAGSAGSAGPSRPEMASARRMIAAMSSVATVRRRRSRR